MKNIAYYFCVISLFGYVFFADFFIAVMGLPMIKLVFAIGAFFFGGLYCLLNYKRLVLKNYLWIPVILCALYVVIIHNTVSINLFYTAIFGFLLVQNRKLSDRSLSFVFWIQFFLVLYEFLTHNLLYTEVSTGLFSISVFEYKDEIFEVSGFRPKGLFPGTLISTAFTIYYACIYRNSLTKTFFAMVMAIMLNGRMAMVSTVFIFMWCYYAHGSKNLRLSQGSRKRIIITFAVLWAVILIYLSTTVIQIGHLFDILNFTTDDNKGRIARYGLGIQEYFFNYSIIQKLFGSKYELFDAFNRSVPPESEIIGMFLEIGLCGFLFYLVTLIYAFRLSSEKVFDTKVVSVQMVVLLTFICMIQYRHVNGNPRGIMFWYMVLSFYLDYKRKGNYQKNKFYSKPLIV